MLENFKNDKVWKNRIEKKEGAFALCLKKYLMTKIEDRMFQCKTNRIKWLDKQGMKHKHQEIEADLDFEVADVQLIFDNHVMIDLLKKRGACIASGKHHLIKKHDEKIEKYLNECKGKEDL